MIDSVTSRAGAAPAIVNLQCAGRTRPLGLDDAAPQFRWAMTGGGRGQRQTAYRLILSSSPEQAAAGVGDVWDSGRVEDSRSAQVAYGGAPLHSATRYHWTVTVWDQEGRVLTAEPTWFETGLLDQARDWNAGWIAAASDPENGGAAPQFRRVFQVTRPLARARLYITSLGIYRAYLNGRPVGDEVLTPGWTDYFIRIPYQTYDVTDLLTEGANALGAVVGNGWYASHLSVNGGNKYGVDVALLAQLVLTYKDGTEARIVTDGSWKSTLEGPFRFTDNQDGETYDARREMDGWACAAFDDSAWKPVRLADRDPLDTKLDLSAVTLSAQMEDPVRRTGTLPVQAVTEPEPGVFLYDLGQNFTGWVRVRLHGAAGTTVRLRYGEMLQADGTLYTVNLRSAKATDRYILRGDQDGEIYEPSLTFHGFRYLEVTGAAPAAGDVTGIVVGSDLRRTGYLETSDPLINRLYANILWGQRGNYLSVPTDCPQRDERLGWTGDAQVFAATGALNYDVDAFLSKYFRDVRDAQLPDGAVFDIAPSQGHQVGAGNAGWGDVATIGPWTLYTAYGDVRVLRDNYDMMCRWVAYCRERAGDTLVIPTCDYGDWLSIGETTPREVVATAFFAHSTHLLAKAAAVLGREQDAAAYGQLFSDICDAFCRSFVDADTGRIHGDSQTAYLLALHFGLLPEGDLRRQAAGHLVRRLRENDWHLATGFLGVSYLCPVLSEAGFGETAYQLLLTKTYPSWLYSVVNGATTVWERWNSYVAETGTFGNPEMNSFNHYAYGSVGQWIYEYAGGIRRDENQPGYHHILLRPQPSAQLPHVCARYDSVYGTIVSDWTLRDGVFTLSVTVPANTTASLRLPAASDEGLTVDGQAYVPGTTAVEGVAFRSRGTGYLELDLLAGTYAFTSRL